MTVNPRVVTIAGITSSLRPLTTSLRRRPARESEREVIVFDSTGMALQDAAAASLIYGRALTLGRGTIVNFGQ